MRPHPRSSKRVRCPLHAGLIVLLVPLLGAPRPPAAAAQEAGAVADALSRLKIRSVGPAIMGGRVSAIAGVPGDRNTFFYGHASGGVFKTVNGGVTFAPIFDDVGVPSIGAIAVAPSDPNVVWVGTGEGNPRNSASVGRGVYRSVDAGETWSLLGLENTEKISRIRVHPTDPDVAWVAALGHEWGDHEERGVYRTSDGGRTWERVLYVDAATGAADLALDRGNPRILYAAMYDHRRRAWAFRSGGPGSGLYRSADGGDTWENLTAAAPANGLPEGLLGRIGVAVAPSGPDVVYAIMENQTDGQIWRSADRGRTWSLATSDGRVNSRPFYFSDLRVDPQNPDRVYTINGTLMVSHDGARSWAPLGRDLHPDHQSFWIDPLDPERLIDGNDGGVYVSYDRGANWRYLNNVPLGQFYQVGADMQEPYHICGGLQDNGVWCGPSETKKTVGLLNDAWDVIHFGDGYYAQIDPTDWTTVFTNAHYGNIVRVDRASAERQSIQPYPVALRGSAAGDHPYRFNWNSPIHMSPTDPQTVYFGSNVLFRTRDGGHSWDRISPDLTTDDPAKQRTSGGEITVDNTSAEYHTTIVTIAESPVDPGVIWVGTDDGLVQVTQDAGASWANVTAGLRGLPEEKWITRVEASHADRATAWVTVDRHRSDDMAPYVFRTTDLGSSWTDVTDDLPDFGFLKVVREDPRNPDVVYVGSELGLFASFTGGGDWVHLNPVLGLPPAPVNDLLVHPRDNDLIVATHGRSIWVLDDLTPLQELTEARAAGVHLFTPPDALRYEYHFTKPFMAEAVFKGDSPPSAAMISYYLGADGDSVTVTVEDARGRVVRTLRGGGGAGVHRLSWELDFDDTPGGGGFITSSPPVRVLPGAYTVRLDARGEVRERPLRVRLDPTLDVGEDDLLAQLEAVERLLRMRKEADEAIEEIGSVQEQIPPLAGRLRAEGPEATAIAERAEAAHAALEAIRLRLVSGLGGYRSATMLQGRISELLTAIGRATRRPTTQQSEWIGRFDVELQEVLGELRTVIDEQITDVNRRVRSLGLPAIEVRERRRTIS